MKKITILILITILLCGLSFATTTITDLFVRTDSFYGLSYNFTASSPYLIFDGKNIDFNQTINNQSITNICSAIVLGSSISTIQSLNTSDIIVNNASITNLSLNHTSFDLRYMPMSENTSIWDYMRAINGSGNVTNNYIYYQINETNNITYNITYNITNNITTNITYNITNNLTQNITYNITNDYNITINTTNNITTNITYNITNNFTSNMSVADLKGLGFNLTTELKTYFDTLYYAINNPSTFITASVNTLTNFYNKTDIDGMNLINKTYLEENYYNKTQIDYNISLAINFNETKYNDTVLVLSSRFNETSLILNVNSSIVRYTHLSNFTDNLGNRGYTHLENFSNANTKYITNDSMNKTVNFSNIQNMPPFVTNSSMDLRLSTHTNDINLINSTYGNNTYAYKSDILWINSSGNATYMDGNVGIGTTTPSAKLDVKVTSGGVATLGFNGNASGDYSVAIGYQAKASGDSATAIGDSVEANGNWAIATGYLTKANGDMSLATGSSTIANATLSTAMGSTSIASGDTSFAVGDGAIASGELSVSMGSSTVASGASSIVMGSETESTNNFSFAWGGDSCTGYVGSCTNEQAGVFAIYGGLCVGKESTSCPNITDGSIYTNGSLNVTDIVYANSFIGDGSLLTGIVTGSSYSFFYPLLNVSTNISINESYTNETCRVIASQFNETSKIPTSTLNLTNDNNFINDTYGNLTYVLKTDFLNTNKSRIDNETLLQNNINSVNLSRIGNESKLQANIDNETKARIDNLSEINISLSGNISFIKINITNLGVAVEGNKTLRDAQYTALQGNDTELNNTLLATNTSLWGNLSEKNTTAYNYYSNLGNWSADKSSYATNTGMLANISLFNTTAFMQSLGFNTTTQLNTLYVTSSVLGTAMSGNVSALNLQTLGFNTTAQLNTLYTTNTAVGTAISGNATIYNTAITGNYTQTKTDTNIAMIANMSSKYNNSGGYISGSVVASDDVNASNINSGNVYGSFVYSSVGFSATGVGTNLFNGSIMTYPSANLYLGGESAPNKELAPFRAYANGNLVASGTVTLNNTSITNLNVTTNISMSVSNSIRIGNGIICYNSTGQLIIANNASTVSCS